MVRRVSRWWGWRCTVCSGEYWRGCALPCHQDQLHRGARLGDLPRPVSHPAPSPYYRPQGGYVQDLRRRHGGRAGAGGGAYGHQGRQHPEDRERWEVVGTIHLQQTGLQDSAAGDTK